MFDFLHQHVSQTLGNPKKYTILIDEGRSKEVAEAIRSLKKGNAMSEQRPFKVGDDVFCLMWGHGSVTSVGTDDFPIRVKFPGRSELWFKGCGRYANDSNRTLYHANSGIIEIDTTLRPELEVDAKIWVRDHVDEEWNRRHFKRWDYDMARCFAAGKTSFTDNDNTYAWNFYTLTDPNGEKD